MDEIKLCSILKSNNRKQKKSTRLSFASISKLFIPTSQFDIIMHKSIFLCFFEKLPSSSEYIMQFLNMLPIYA